MVSDHHLRKIIDEHILLEGQKRSQKSQEDIHIGYGIDENYVRCMGSSITSICYNNPNENLIFHVLTNEIKPDSLRKLKQLADDFAVKIYIYTINSSFFSHLPVQAHFPVSIYYRFILPMILEVPKVLYLDADVICMGKINKLFSIDMKNNVALVVPDLEPLATKRNRILGLSNHTYFNSGVLLIDIKNWNQTQVAHKVQTKLAQEPAKYRYPDQDALNMVLAGKVHYLGKEYNRINTPDMIDDGIVFLHFAAHPKPWTVAWDKSDLCNDFTRDIYRKYEALSPWHGIELVKPKNYKEMRSFAKCLLKAGSYIASFYWYGKYIQTKIKVKLTEGNNK